MNKIFKIASYDFKRLIINPITLIAMIVVLIAVFITGLAYPIPTTPAYEAKTLGETTHTIFTNFNGTNPQIDTKSELDKLMTEAEEYLNTQKQCLDYDSLLTITPKFKKIKAEVEKYGTLPENCIYISQGNIDEIKEAADELKSFVEDFSKLGILESNVIFTQEQFEELEIVANYFYEQTHSGKPIRTILDDLLKNINNFDKPEKIAQNLFLWQINDEKLAEYKTKYIDDAKTKTTKIYNEMFSYNNDYSVDNISKMNSLITNYKLTCESSKYAIIYELLLSLEKHFGNLKNLYHYQPIRTEEAKLALTKVNYFLSDESLYYTQHQQALNFNTASYEVSTFDHAYFIISIIGFMTILFGIFAAYKLFGLDRRNGKMDIILSQNVTFGQVYAGKFMAIVLTTSFMLTIFSILSLTWGALLYPALTGSIFAVFNMNVAYTIHPFLFFLIKVVGIELQVIFYAVLTMFLMNLSRKFDIMFVISLLIFVLATVCNIFLNGSFVYCLLPFIHADLTAFLGGGTMQSGFLVTALYSNGNFFISLFYYLVFVALLYNFTKALFKKN